MSRANRKWFVARAGKITGPHCTITVESEIQSRSKTEEILFWSRGQAQWLDSSHWTSVLKQDSLKAVPRETRTWSVELDGFIQNLDSDHVRDFVERNLEDAWKIRFKPEHVDQWLDISQLPSLMNSFDLKRFDDRAPVIGTVRLEFGKKIHEARAKDLSSTGLGVSGLDAIPLGQVMPVIFESPNLVASLHTHVQLIYRSSDGSAGLRFVGLTAEHTSAIVSYLKRFLELRTNPEHKVSMGIARA